jgi:hypothetical protein
MSACCRSPPAGSLRDVLVYYIDAASDTGKPARIENRVFFLSSHCSYCSYLILASEPGTSGWGGTARNSAEKYPDRFASKELRAPVGACAITNANNHAVLRPLL